MGKIDPIYLLLIRWHSILFCVIVSAVFWPSSSIILLTLFAVLYIAYVLPFSSTPHTILEARDVRELCTSPTLARYQKSEYSDIQKEGQTNFVAISLIISLNIILRLLLSHRKQLL
jgi:hypothetical protein